MGILKFRAWQDNEMLQMPMDGYFGLSRLIGFLRDDAVLMQCTGIKDKNGKLIYEGDICKIHIFTQELGENMGVTEGEKEFIAEIIISEHGEGVVLKRKNMEDSGPIWAYYGMHEESFEIIGNIHENSELLKK